jgi:hypothetical protein
MQKRFYTNLSLDLEAARLINEITFKTLRKKGNYRSRNNRKKNEQKQVLNLVCCGKWNKEKNNNI